MFIEIFDNRDKELLIDCILGGIKDLADLRDKAAGWGCGTMTTQDAIDRLQRILKEVAEA